MSEWDHKTDFLVVGSGGGGMTAALVAKKHGLDVLVIEKTGLFGGSTGLSGGNIWIPNNPHMEGVGVRDSREDALVYLKGITKGRVPEERIVAYVDKAPEMVRYLEANSDVKFMAVPRYPDYYPEHPGGKIGARSIEPLPFRAGKLGPEEKNLRRSGQGLVLGRMGLTAKEAHTLVQFSFWSFVLMFWIMLKYWFDIGARRKGRGDGRLCLGVALVGRLRRALMDANVPLWLNAACDDLIVEDGRVVGAKVLRDGDTVRIRAERGVLFAAGGFAKNAKLRQQYQQAPIGSDWTAACEGNTGEVIGMGQALGAAVDLMDDAWWTPVTLLPDGYPWLLVVEKSMPGCIMVNRAGKRFTNEAAPYVDVVKGQYAANAEHAPSIPAYLIFDQRYRRSYPCGPLGPSRLQPDSSLPKRLRQGFLKKSGTLAGLADKLGVDAAGLEAEIARFNQFAKAGKDEDFQRGDSLYDRYYSDSKIKPNPSLAPIVEAPFYAIEVWPGDLGTKGGLVTDVDGRVLKEDGSAIPGLYATGNCSAAVMGNTYPGAGGTIGPSMTFGYAAALHAAGAATAESARNSERAAAE